MDIENIVRGIMEAQREALKEGIRANTVVISNRFAKIKSFAVGGWRGNKGTMTFPPMIAGLEAYFTDGLPEELAFAIMEKPGPTEIERLRIENQHLKEQIAGIRELLGMEGDA